MRENSQIPNKSFLPFVSLSLVGRRRKCPSAAAGGTFAAAAAAVHLSLHLLGMSAAANATTLLRSFFSVSFSFFPRALFTIIGILSDSSSSRTKREEATAISDEQQLTCVCVCLFFFFIILLLLLLGVVAKRKKNRQKSRDFPAAAQQKPR
jgi:preprotein translocase subunit SecG